MPRAVVAVPSGITEVERRAVVDAVAATLILEGYLTYKKHHG